MFEQNFTVLPCEPTADFELCEFQVKPNRGQYLQVKECGVQNFSFKNGDYTLVGSTSRQTMKILPNSLGLKTQQKVALGDHDGVMQIFSMKRGEVQHTFKSISGPKITSVELGGVPGGVKDKVFVSSENEVKGYSKKGKLFLEFESNLTEHIQHMSVLGNHLMVAGHHTFHHYESLEEAGDLAFSDKITNVMALPLSSQGNKIRSVIACEDKTLHFLQDPQQPPWRVELSTVPSTLEPLFGNGGDTGGDVLYGGQDGSIGLVNFGFKANQEWVLESSSGGVTCMDHYDLTGDGVPELLVGRDDGLIEAYAFDEMQDMPVRRLTHACNESIMSIQGGMVGSCEHDEIVATTFTGWLFGLTTETKDKDEGLREGGSTGVAREAREKIHQLRCEIDGIEQKVMKERERYQQATQSKSEGLSALPYISVNDKFTLSQTDASYSLTIEVQTAIDNVLIQSNVALQLLDVEKNSAVVSYSACDPESGNHLLATYRCQVNTTRLEVRVRTTEGQSGELRAYITLMLQPKCCQVRSYPIRPLSLHARCHDLDTTRPYNILRLSGSYSLAEVHSWIALSLPEVPEKAPLQDEGSLTFTNTLLKTLLHCTYMKGSAEFKSDNMTTISILKDVLTKEATKKKIKLDISVEVNEASSAYVLQLLHPRLEAQHGVARQVQVLGALRELQQAGATLQPRHQELLQREPELLAELKRQPAQLQQLHGLVTELYVDTHKFRGSNARSKIPIVQSILQNYDLQTLVSFFGQQN